MINMEDYNDASAMAAPGIHQQSAGLENDSPAQGNSSGLNMYRHHSECVHVCVCVIKNISWNKKHKKRFSVPQMQKGALSLFLKISARLFYLFIRPSTVWVHWSEMKGDVEVAKYKRLAD